MDLPNNIRYLIEALRGGGSTTFNKGGQMVDQQYGPASGAKPVGTQDNFMPKNMRGYQLYNQEQRAQGLPTVSYQEWLKLQGT